MRGIGTFSLDGLVSQVRLVNVGGNSPGAIVGVDVVMSSSKALVRGTITDFDGNPVALSELTLTNGASTRVLYSAHEPIGEYTFGNLDPGTYTLTATLTGAAPVVRLVTVQAGDALPASLQLGQQASLTGVVLNPDTSPAAGLTVRLYLPINFPGGSTVLTTTTAADGSYSFEDVAAPEDFVVAVFSSPGSVDVIDSELVVSVPGIEVVIGGMVNV